MNIQEGCFYKLQQNNRETKFIGRYVKIKKEKMKNQIATISLVLLVVAISPTVCKATENSSSTPTIENIVLIFEEDFDNYVTGTFPLDWEIIYEGRGVGYQVIDDSQFVSSPNSLKLEGRSGWAGVVGRRIDPRPVMWFEVYVMTAEAPLPTWMGNNIAWVGFYGVLPRWGRWYGSVSFKWENEYGYFIPSDNGPVPYELHTWYKVRVRTDLTTRTFDAWVNDTLIHSNAPTRPDGEPEVLALCANNMGSYTKAWFDNVRVWAELPFSLSISPTSGSVVQGKSATATVTILPIDGYEQTVTLSASDVPSGVSVDFNPSSGVPPFDLTMTLTTSSTTPQGSYALTITARDAYGDERSAIYLLEVAAPSLLDRVLEYFEEMENLAMFGIAILIGALLMLILRR